MLYHKGTEFQVTLTKKYNDTSFQNFTSLILEMAREKKHGFGQCSIYSMGGHVMPYHLCCAPCDVDYDVIGMTEDFRDRVRPIHLGCCILPANV